MPRSVSPLARARAIFIPLLCWRPFTCRLFPLECCAYVFFFSPLKWAGSNNNTHSSSSSSLLLLPPSSFQCIFYNMHRGRESEGAFRYDCRQQVKLLIIFFFSLSISTWVVCVCVSLSSHFARTTRCRPLPSRSIPWSRSLTYSVSILLSLLFLRFSHAPKSFDR